jgi:hypothetical protein
MITFGILTILYFDLNFRNHMRSANNPLNFSLSSLLNLVRVMPKAQINVIWCGYKGVTGNAMCLNDAIINHK